MAQTIAEMAWVLIIGAGVVFCLVMFALMWALRHRRPPAGDDRTAATWWIVGGGLVLPLLVLSALLVYTVWRTNQLTPARLPREPIISVVAHMWWWEVRYREPARGIDVVLANEIHLPVGRAVTLGLASADVIHSFWVPALAGKIDMLPERVHQLRVQADRPGVYRGQCAEFCGEQHARMALHVVAQAPEAFERWLQAQNRPAEAPHEPAARRGAQVFAEQRCSVCHTVRGLWPAASIGPDLTHVGSRLHLAAGTLPMDTASLRHWIAHPQASKPGVRMPSYERLDAESLGALAAFLEQLK
ncbi:MAG TPA: cytochrome c oxidase subunit II [Rubrivivax sp.]